MDEKFHIKMLSGMYTAIEYEESEERMLLLINELICRLKGDKGALGTDYGDFIWNSLIYTFGDYGISPRYGWFNDENMINDFIEYLEKEKSLINLILKL